MQASRFTIEAALRRSAGATKAASRGARHLKMPVFANPSPHRTQALSGIAAARGAAGLMSREYVVFEMFTLSPG